MMNYLFNAYEHESYNSYRELSNKLDHNSTLEDLLTEWFSPDYLLG